MTLSFVLAMLRVSFRSLPSASFPSPRGRKPALAGLAAAVIVLAGCGGGGHKATASDVQTVTGGGYRFSAPSSWSVHRTGRQVTATSGEVHLVGVTTFTLARRYRPSLWARAVPALDRAAAALRAPRRRGQPPAGPRGWPAAPAASLRRRRRRRARGRASRRGPTRPPR